MNEDGEIDMQLLLMHTIAQTGYFSEFIEKLSDFTPTCHKYTDGEIFHYNYYAWCLGFFLLGLQFVHLDAGPLQHFVLVWSVMKTWGWAMWLVFIALVLFIAVAA